MKNYQSAIIAPRRQARPGMIRYGIVGAVLGLLAFPAARLVCEWAVWGGSLLEGWLK